MRFKAKRDGKDVNELVLRIAYVEICVTDCKWTRIAYSVSFDHAQDMSHQGGQDYIETEEKELQYTKSIARVPWETPRNDRRKLLLHGMYRPLIELSRSVCVSLVTPGRNCRDSPKTAQKVVPFPRSRTIFLKTAPAESSMFRD